MPEWLADLDLRLLFDGVQVTLLLTLITTIGASALALGLGMARSSPWRIARLVSGIYIEVFRNVPALIQVIFWAFAFPSAFSAARRQTLFFDNTIIDWLGALTGLALPYYAFAACLGLILNTSAHLAEILRSGIRSIPTHRLEAAAMLGASRLSTYRKVVIPQALQISFPALSTRLIHNMKNTALASFVAVPELFHAMQASINKTFNATTYLLVAAVMYLALSALMTIALNTIDQRLNRLSAR